MSTDNQTQRLEREVAVLRRLASSYAIEEEQVWDPLLRSIERLYGRYPAISFNGSDIGERIAAAQSLGYDLVLPPKKKFGRSK